MHLIFVKPSADDLLKATVLREIEVPGYTRADGTYVPPHRKHVNVNPDVSQEDVLGGRGSHSQREAVTRLRRQEWFQNLSPEHRYHHVLSHATDIQLRRSAAAALSRQRAAAGTARDEPAAPARESAAAG